MRLHRFFIEDIDFTPSRIVITEPDAVNQIKNVLRLKKGSQLILADGSRKETLATVAAITKRGVEVTRGEVRTNEIEPVTDVILYCAVLKRENFEWVSEKATEVGVKAIVPIRTERTIKQNLNLGRLEKIAKEATEQSGRGEVPEISPILEFEEAVKNAAANFRNLFMETYIHGPFEPPKKGIHGPIGVFIGPEGGWTDEEREFVLNHKDFELASLGKLTLRAETAAVIASYLAVQQEL